MGEAAPPTGCAPRSVHTWEEAATPELSDARGGDGWGLMWHESGREGRKETQSDRDRNGEREMEIESCRNRDTDRDGISSSSVHHQDTVK